MARRARQTAPPPKPEPHWLRPLTLGLAALLLLAWFSTAVSDNDTWWHLKTGQYILQNHRLPVPDPFSFTTYMGKALYAGEESTRQLYLAQEWLAQAFFYGLYVAGGFAAIVLFRALDLLAICAVVGFVAYRRCGGFYRALGAGLLAASVAVSYTGDRPFLISFLLLAVVILILELRRPLWLLPVLFVLWSNCHGDFVLGWAAMGVYAAESLLMRWRGAPAAHERRLWLCCAAAVAASALNPNGYRSVAFLLASHNSVIQSHVWEWKSPTLWPPQPFNVVLALALVILVAARRRVRPSDWMLFALFAAGTMMAERNLLLIGIAGPILIATYFPWSRTLPRAATLGIPVLLAAAAAVPIARGDAFQLRAVLWNRPSGAADFLLAHPAPGHLFNGYSQGGYLMWRLNPQNQVFIDGRALNESVYRDFVSIANNHPDRESLLQQYGAGVILMEGFEDVTGVLWPLILALADPARDEWKLVYWDKQAFVFMRNPPEGVAVLPSVQVLDGLEAQCGNHVEQEPETAGCTVWLANLFNRIGNRGKAQKWMALAGAAR
jgi:hypothetical protein